MTKRTASLHQTNVWALRHMRYKMRQGDFSDTFGFWYMALKNPAIMRQLNLTFDDLMRAAKGYANSVQSQVANGDFTGALRLRSFVNFPEFPITWVEIGIAEETVCLWIEKGARQLVKGLGSNHEHALTLLELFYFYPDTRKILSDRQIDLVVRTVTRWAQGLYRTIQQLDLSPQEGTLLSLRLMSFIAFQTSRERTLKAPINLDMCQLCGFTWQDVYSRHQFWKAKQDATK